MDTYDNLAAVAALHGVAVNTPALRDADLCRRQNDRLAAGFVELVVYRNIYGWTFRATHNDYNGGMALRDARSLKTIDDAVDAAWEWCASVPGKRSIDRIQLADGHLAEPVEGGWQVKRLAGSYRRDAVFVSPVMLLSDVLTFAREYGLIRVMTPVSPWHRLEDLTVTGNQYRTVVDFEAGLSLGMAVTVAWTSCGSYYRRNGRVVKINAKSVRVALDAIQPGERSSCYAAGAEIFVPRLDNIRDWSCHNRVEPRGGYPDVA